MTLDEIRLEAPQDRRRSHTVFLITGNPGLIAYYRTFLNAIHEKANAQNPDIGVRVYGKSLGGFEVQAAQEKRGVLSLEDQIVHVQQAIDDLCKTSAPADKMSLTLIGHSVGAYILLRLIENYHASRQGEALRYEIQAGILLFPTVMDIAKSASGTRVSMPLAIPLGPAIGGNVAWASAQLVPRSYLRSIVAQLPAFRGAKKDSEKDQAVEATVAFLKSSYGVTQCMSMAADEMRDITLDRFGQEVWGSATPNAAESSNGSVRPKLFFYFGESDHWVADKTRDALIAARAFEPSGSLVERSDWELDSRPWMEIDQKRTGHSFCVQDSSIVADKVAEYLRVVL